jgi:5-(aminomethyl)-3-furanmethanol phosphate kinase
MTAASPAAGAISVIKIGGGLAAVSGALDRVCCAVAQAARDHRVVVVPGGGPFADAVREFDRRVGVSADAAHWMAILAMDQYAHVLAGRIPGAVLVEEPGALSWAAGPSRVAVLAPSRWMRSADVLPHTWEVTSDSIAAFVAGALDAARLILIKPAEDGEPVDSYFATALPTGMSCLIIGYDQIEQLAERLTG